MGRLQGAIKTDAPLQVKQQQGLAEMSSIRTLHTAGPLARSLPVLFWGYSTSIFQRVGYQQPRRTVFAQMRRSFLGRRPFDRSHAPSIVPGERFFSFYPSRMMGFFISWSRIDQ